MIIMRLYPSQLTPSNWYTPFLKKWPNTPHGLFHQPKVHLYVIAVTHFMVFDIMSHRLFFHIIKIGDIKPRGFRHKQWMY